MPIDKDGKKYLAVSQIQPYYIKQIQFTAPDGNPAFREEFIQPSDIEMNQYNLEQAGWFKELIYKEVARQTVYRPIPNSMSFRKTTAIVLSTYKVVTDRKNALLKIMPSGVFLRQFKENGKDITISYFLSSNQIKNGNYTLLSEKELIAKEAKRLIENGDSNCLDLGLRRDLGLGHI
jgi:hypothetical protein